MYTNTLFSSNKIKKWSILCFLNKYVLSNLVYMEYISKEGYARAYEH